MEEALVALLTVIVVGTLWWIRTRFRVLYSTFREIGVPGPRPHFIFGNMKEVWECKKPWVVLDEWYHRYGKVFGCFPMGIRPIMVVGDLDMIKDILHTYFANFRNRPPLGPPRSEPGASSLTTLRGERWKRVRNVISPTFTAKKMRQMSESMNAAADTFVSVLDDKADTKTSFDIYAMFQALTLDVIAQAAFALSVDCQKNSDDALLKVCRMLFKSFFGPMMKLLLLFPELGSMCMSAAQFLRSRSGAASQELFVITHVRKILKSRVQSATRGQDMIQLMMDASAEHIGPNEVAKTCLHPEPVQPTGRVANRPETEMTIGSLLRGKYLTENELVANCFVFLLAGYETTANALAFSSYLLARHPEIQDRLYAEIAMAVGENQNNSNSFEDSGRHLPYLEAVIKESLRLYPPITGFVMREAREDCVVRGVMIPQNMAVIIPVWSLHHDPSYWPDPHVFNPDRFMGANIDSIPQMAFMAFGDGPRNCIGMNFAMMEIRITLVRMLRKFRLVMPITEDGPLDLESPFVTMNPKNGVKVELERR